jgi:hypothetical protein
MRGTARYLIGLVCGFLVIAAIWFGLFVASFGYYGGFGDRCLAAWYQIKTAAAVARMHHPKIILAAGSNVRYGIDAAMIERELGVPCVNYGTHASLPLDYLLHRWRSVLEPGDLFVIAPEYRFLERSPDDMNDVFAGYMLAEEPSYFWELSLPNQIELVLTTDFSRLLMPLFTSFRENQKMEEVLRLWTQAYYLDEQGDYIANAPEARDKAALEKILKSSATENLVNGYQLNNATAETPYWREIRKLANWARHHNVRVVYTAPSVLAVSEISNPSYRKFFAAVEAHYRALGIPVLITQQENIYPEELMFDNIYHPNSKGRTIRTENLMHALAPIVKQQFPGAKVSSSQPSIR